MTLIDTHTHLDWAARDGTVPEVLGRARAAGVEQMIAIGTEPEDWDLYRGLSRAHPESIRYSVGIHPCSVGEGWRGWAGSIEEHWSLGDPVPVALGECGLDRFHLPKDPAQAEEAYDRQKAAFEAQLAIAARLGCPVVIHSRQAFADCVALIDASGVSWEKVVFHCFSEGEAQLRELASRGGRASFTGILTYKNAEPVRAAARAQGLERLMIETDAPYLAPAPHRGKPNEPAYLLHTAQYAANLFDVGLEAFAASTTAAARSFFGL